MASRSGLYTDFLPPSEHQSEERNRKINLVIFDIDFNHHSMSNQRFQTKIFTEEEVDGWFDYITSGINDVHLFISNIISNSFVQLISEYPQIKSVYIFCKDPQYQNYSNDEHKLRGVFHVYERMFEQFQNDINQRNNQSNFEQNTFQNINSESGEVLWWKFFNQFLQYIQHTDIARNEFIEFSKTHSPNNQKVLKDIEEFERSYTSDKAIHWYTRGVFLYPILNGTLRTQNNLNNIFKLRLILSDIMSGLKTEYSNNNGSQNSLIAYRGQTMKPEEIERLKSDVGNIICFNQLFSTTMNKNIAQGFAEGSTDPCCSEHVLFTIEIDSLDMNNSTTLFANISKISFYEEEDEVLFSMHSTFLVQSITLDHYNFYQIHLKFKDNPWDEDYGQRSLFNPYVDEIFIQNLPNENKQSIGFQLLLDMILRLDQTEYAKQELLEFARSKYQDDRTEMKKINDFNENYRSEDAIKWYTKHSFLYRLLNESLHAEPINCIVKMRYFIHDIHNQIDELQPSFIQSLNGQTNVILYRGRKMKIHQLNEIIESIGGLISMKNFFSATQNMQVAIAYSGKGYTTNLDEVAVMYEILIDTNIRSTSYAKIESVNPNEEEILFSMGSVFRIGNVHMLHDRMYSIKLTMEHIEDELWNKLTAHLD